MQVELRKFEVTVDFIGTRTYTIEAVDADDAMDIAQLIGLKDRQNNNLPDIFVEAVCAEQGE
jgi:hypothetical protein